MYNAGMKQHIQSVRVSIFIIFLLAITGISAKTASAIELGLGGSANTNTAATALSGDVSPSSLPVLRTSVGLSIAVDQIVQKVEGTSDADFCVALDGIILGLDNDSRETLAWRTSSYEANTKLSAKADASEEIKGKYESLQSAYADLNTKIDSSIDANDGASLRAATALRSVYLELLGEYRGGNPNEARTTSLSTAINKISECVNKEDTNSLKNDVSVALGGSATAPAPMVVTRADVGEDTNTDVKAESVSSKAELSTYAKAVLAKNTDITAITTDATRTEVAVRQKGKLFAFIPVHITAKAAVAGEGKVTVKYPWYKFLIRVPNKVTSEMVLEKLPKEVSSSTTLSAKAQAQSVDAAVNAFMIAE